MWTPVVAMWYWSSHANTWFFYCSCILSKWTHIIEEWKELYLSSPTVASRSNRHPPIGMQTFPKAEHMGWWNFISEVISKTCKPLIDTTEPMWTCWKSPHPSSGCTARQHKLRPWDSNLLTKIFTIRWFQGWCSSFACSKHKKFLQM